MTVAVNLRAPTAPAADPRLAVAAPGALVGRRGELARLRSAWAGAGRGGTVLAVVAGEDGAGKTRLVAEVAAEVSAGGGSVLVGRCRAVAPRPYEPFTEALAAEPSACDPDGLTAALDRAGAATGGRPVLLVLEDLDRATPSTVRLLDRLVRSGTGAALVVATCRAGSLAPAHPLARFLADPALPDHHRVFLENLSPQAVTALLVDRAAAAGSAGSRLATALWEASAGWPLLVTESLADLAAAGAVGAGAVDWAAIERTGLPRDLDEIVARRLGRIGPRAAGVVEALAVGGDGTTAGRLAAACTLRIDAVRSDLARAGRARLVVPDPAGGYRFVHARVGAAVLAGVVRSRRARLHLRFASGAGRGPDADAAALHHLAAAATSIPSGEAVARAEAVGDAASALLAFEEACAAYGQALAFLGTRRNASDGRARLLLKLGVAERSSGEPARARQAFVQAAAAARTAGDAGALARAALELAEVPAVWGTDDLLVRLLDEAAASSAGDDRVRLLARLDEARRGPIA